MVLLLSYRRKKETKEKKMTDSYMCTHSHLISISLNDNNTSGSTFRFGNLHHFFLIRLKEKCEKKQSKFE